MKKIVFIIDADWIPIVGQSLWDNWNVHINAKISYAFFQIKLENSLYKISEYKSQAKKKKKKNDSDCNFSIFSLVRICILIFHSIYQGLIQKIFLGGGSMKKFNHNCDQVHTKHIWDLYRVYIDISELMLWLHWGEFVKVKWESLGACV